MADTTDSLVRFDEAQLRNDDFALSREWLVTNGIGGYGMSSVSTANTRRYHGLLVAALNPPLGRAVLLSKLEPSLKLRSADGSTSSSVSLSANVYPDTVYPNGNRLLTYFSSEPAPTWKWAPFAGVTIEQTVWMDRDVNRTHVRYKLLAAPEGAVVELSLTPLIAWKDFHSEMRATDDHPEMSWAALDDDAPATEGVAVLKLTLPPIEGITSERYDLSLQFRADDGTSWPGMSYTESSDWFYRFQHPRDRERGQDFEEDLFAPGTITGNLRSGEAIVVTAEAHIKPGGADALPISQSWDSWVSRREELSAGCAIRDSFSDELARAADVFVIQVPGKRSTILAGYPWFSDWGRDTMISLPGLCISTGRLEVAREILVSFSAFTSEGMLPNRFPDAGETPEYNTVDATLWYFVAIYHYIQASGDRDLLANTLWSVLKDIIGHHQSGTRFQIHVDGADQLLYAGENGVQLTWMDAKIGDWVVTPRIGKPVEINALWVNALYTMEYFASLLHLPREVERFASLALAARDSFRSRFPRPDGLGLFDVLDVPWGDHMDLSVRPNQVFAVSLPFAPIDADSDAARSVVDTVQHHLYTDAGMRTLSPADGAFRPRYEGDGRSRDSAYHQGTVWPWLSGAFAEAHYKVYGDASVAAGLISPFGPRLKEYCVGNLAEIYDATAPYNPHGCVAQAWSIAETLRVWQMLAAAEK